MKLHSKILCYLLMATVLLPQFLNSQPQEIRAATVSPPPPDAPCIEQPSNSSGITSSTDIVCKIADQTLTFKNTGIAGKVSVGAGIWGPTNETVVLYNLQITGYSIMQGSYYAAVYIDSSNNYIMFSILYIFQEAAIRWLDTRLELNTGTETRKFISSSLTGPNSIIPPPIFPTDSDSTKQAKEKLKADYNDPNVATKETATLDALNILAKKIQDVKGLGVVPYVINFTKALTACSAFNTQPLSSGKGTNTIQTLFDSMAKAMTDSVNGAQNLNPDKKKTAIAYINNTLGKPENFLTKERDETLFATFYSADPDGGPPDIRPDGDLYKKFSTMITNLSFKAPLGYDLKQYLGIIGQFMQGKMGAAISGAGLTVGGIGAIGAALGGGITSAVVGTAVGGAAGGLVIGDAIAKWQQDKALEETLKYMIPIIVAYYYFKANLAYNKCAKKAGDPAAFYDQAIEDSLDSLLLNTTNIANAYAADVGAGKTACDKINQGFIMTGIAQAICGFTILFKKWANSFICMAEGYLEASLGVKKGNTGDPTAETESACANVEYNDKITGEPGNPTGTTPTGTTATPGAPAASTPTPSDIKQQATQFCLEKKMVILPTDLVAFASWQTGPCLSENFNNTGYAIDLVHVPGLTVDTTNVCASKIKLIKLNLNDCSVVP